MFKKQYKSKKKTKEVGQFRQVVPPGSAEGWQFFGASLTILTL